MRQNYKGKINYASDCWIAPNHRTFLTLLAFFKRDGKTEVLVLNVIKVPESHHGTKLAEIINDCLKSFSIKNKASSLVVL